MSILNANKQFNFTSAPGVANLDSLNKFLYLEDDISFSATNTYEDPLQKIKEVMNSSPLGETINGLSALAGVAMAATGFRLQTRFSALEAWTQSSKLSFSTKFKFNIGSIGVYSGLVEVYTPIVQLGAICLPWADGAIMKGPGPSFTALMTAFGKDFMNTFTGKASEIKTAADDASKKASAAQTTSGDGGSEGGTNQLTKTEIDAKITKATKETEKLTTPTPETTSVNENSLSGRMIHFRIGPKGRLFDSKQYPGGFIPKDFSYTFSKELDSKGYPISGFVSISWQSFVMATASDSFGRGG